MELTPPEVALDPIRLNRLTSGAVMVELERALVRVEGSGAVLCLQGLLTNDLVKPGEHAISWGALLTPKGMIESDLWAVRQGNSILLVLPPAGMLKASPVFKRSLPPRLARMTELTGLWRTLQLYGAGAEQVLRDSGIVRETPAPGQVVAGADGLVVAQPLLGGPFGFLVAGPAEMIILALGRLQQAGATVGTTEDADAARILAGWPALGAEIDDKTLPQEVRFDELGGVSYTKGCYLGQETVARIHFRGHPNRELRGLEWDDVTSLDGVAIAGTGREVGTVRSTLLAGGQRIGLAPIRREVQVGEMVTAGGRPARVVSLPFGGPQVA